MKGIIDFLFFFIDKKIPLVLSYLLGFTKN